MQSHPVEVTTTVKLEANDFCDPPSTVHLHSTTQELVELSSSSEDESPETEDKDAQSINDSSKQLVLYEPAVNGAGQIEPVPQPLRCRLPFGRYGPPRVLPSVGAFTVQCAKCFKWRLIPTKDKYEEIREHIREQPFFCETAHEWRPDISCDDPTDIKQDGSRLWAIDKPNIAQPPPGWQRLLRIRGEGSTKFADVYYVAPSGKRFRSMVEIQKYLIEHPEFMRDGVTLSKFSFQIPRPLQEDYVRKKRPRITASCDNARPPEVGEAKSLTWVGPDVFTELQLGRPALPPAPSPPSLPFGRTTKKKARTPSKRMYRTNQDQENVEEPDQSRNGDYDL